MGSQTFDLVVIGMGSAGTLAAEFAARDLGLKVAAVERDRVGGDCLWTGCVPSKTLVASARVAHTVRHAARYGIGGGEPDVDLHAVWARIAAVRNGIAATDDDPERFRELGVELMFGTARVTGAREVTVTNHSTPSRSGDAGERVLATRHVLICTGSRPTVPAIAGLADVPYLTNEQLFDLDRPPSSLVLIGGGPIGAELSQSMVRLGVPTTVFESAPRLLPRDEPELADRITRILRDEGVEIHLGSPVIEVTQVSGSAGADSQHGAGVSVRSDDTEVTAAAVVVTAGRTANVESLGLERLGIPVSTDGISVDGRSRTIVPTISAVGDAAAGRQSFTHSAGYDAVMAVRDMFFPGRGLAAGLVPWCTFTDPELAHVGMTAAEARESFGKRSVEVHRHEVSDLDRARADGRLPGAIIIVTAKGRIVGAHALAPTAGELIHELALAIRFGLDLDDLSQLVHIYPTYATGIAQIAAERSFRTGHRFRLLTRLSRWLG